MDTVKVINVTEFKQKCLELLDPEKPMLEPILVTRRGTAIAIIKPPDRAPAADMRGSVGYNVRGIENITFEEECNMK